MAPPLEWFKGATHRTTDTAKQKVWLSKCGRYKVVESSGLYEHHRGKPVVRWLAVRHDLATGGEYVITSHCRGIDAAKAVCQDDLEQERQKRYGDNS